MRVDLLNQHANKSDPLGADFDYAQAFKQLDYGQYELVKEALSERRTFLDIAPHLSSPLPIMLPLYTWWEVPYFWVGCKMYDLLAGDRALLSSYLLNHDRALEAFPMLKSESLKAALVYYDGQQNDARMNVSLAMTSAAHGFQNGGVGGGGGGECGDGWTGLRWENDEL